MARTDNLTNFLTDVAEAIRAKGGTSEKLSASEFDTAITNLPSGGGDIPLFGSTVSVQALKAVTKGQMWQGVENENYNDTLGTSIYTNIPSSAYFSDDLKVVIGGIATTHSSSPTVECSVKIGFLDESSNQYILATVSLPGTSYESIASKYTSTFALGTINSNQYHVNGEGTLAVCTIMHRGTDSAVTDEYNKYIYQTFALEINRDEKKIEVYPINIPGFDGSYNSGSVGIFKNYIFARTANAKTEIYSYSGGNATLTNAYNNGSYNIPKSRFHMVKTADGYVVPVKSSSGYYSTAYYMKETADGLEIISKTAYGQIATNSSSTFYVFSINQKYAIVGTSSTQATSIYSFNYADWTLGEKICALPAYYAGRLFKDTSDYAILYETSSTQSFYKIEDNSVTLLQSKLQGISGGVASVYFTANRFMTTTGYVYVLGSNEAQYLIEPWLTAIKEEGKAYGLVTETLVAGDTGTAQLL